MHNMTPKISCRGWTYACWRCVYFVSILRYKGTEIKRAKLWLGCVFFGLSCRCSYKYCILHFHHVDLPANIQLFVEDQESGVFVIFIVETKHEFCSIKKNFTTRQHTRVADLLWATK